MVIRMIGLDGEWGSKEDGGITTSAVFLDV
jgi:hypothetical protein